MAPGTSTAPWEPRWEAICCILTASLAFSSVGVARADMITTERVVNSIPQVFSDSALMFLRRSDNEYQLRSPGVEQEFAGERVAPTTDEKTQAAVGKLDSLYTVAQYVPPPLVGAVGTVGVSGGYAGGYAGGYVPAVLLGVLAALYWKSAQTNASNQDYMTSNPAPMDPNRRISEQDCTKPIVYNGGNLRCK